MEVSARSTFHELCWARHYCIERADEGMLSPRRLSGPFKGLGGSREHKVLMKGNSVLVLVREIRSRWRGKQQHLAADFPSAGAKVPEIPQTPDISSG
jgi:hypothetical protein